MIDMYDIPASWVGELIEVHKAGFHTTGTVANISAGAEFTDLFAVQFKNPNRRIIHKSIDIHLLTLEGNLTFEDLVKGAYEIDLINKEGN